MVDHVIEAERHYVRKLGVPLPPRTPWDQQRAALLEALRDAPADSSWSPRYVLRRTAWHVLDHAWEMQDRSS